MNEPTWHGYCFMVYWILHQAHLKEVGLTQNRETTELQNLTTLTPHNHGVGFSLHALGTAVGRAIV